jgi:hypothetical protein
MNVTTIIAAIIEQMPEIGKWQRNFLQHLFMLWLSMRGRYNFLNLSRYGEKNEATYRHQFSRLIDWVQLNSILIKKYTSKDRIAVFDPCFISKSGKKTPESGYFWSGCASKAMWGLEIGGLSVVDIQAWSAYHLVAVQSQKSSEAGLLEQYCQIVKKQAQTLKDLTNYLVADAFFAKKCFVDAVLTCQLTFITRLRQDVALFYPSLEKPREGRGRPKKFGGRVDLNHLSEAHFTPCACDENERAFEAKCFVKAWKIWAKVVVVQKMDGKGRVVSRKIYASTDPTQSGAEVWLFYKARFQSEFIYRDAKQHTGLQDCQSRQSEALDFHFNTSLTAVSIAKIIQKNDPEIHHKAPFSMANIKSRFFNDLLLNRFFVMFGFDQNIQKINPIYLSLINFGTIAA